MNILGIDTTTKSASCSIYMNGDFNTKSVTNEITHSEKLLPIIHETLNESSITLNDINLLAAINGPGSFTGIRIGLATIKAFAQVKNIDIYSISSIDLISYTAFSMSHTNEAYVLSIIDARNSRVYYGLNKLTTQNGKVNIEKVLDISNNTIDELVSLLEKENIQNIIIAGNCVETFREKLEKYSSILLNIYPTTEDLINSYLNILDTSSYMYNAYSLDALYARPSQAERMSND